MHFGLRARLEAAAEAAAAAAVAAAGGHERQHAPSLGARSCSASQRAARRLALLLKPSSAVRGQHGDAPGGLDAQPRRPVAAALVSVRRPRASPFAVRSPVALRAAAAPRLQVEEGVRNVVLLLRRRAREFVWGWTARRRPR